MQRRHPGIFILLILLTSTLVGSGQESAPKKKQPHPPTSTPPYPLDQPVPKRRPARPHPTAEPTQPAAVKEAIPAPPVDESARRNRMPGYLVFIGLVLLLLRKVPADKK